VTTPGRCLCMAIFIAVLGAGCGESKKPAVDAAAERAAAQKKAAEGPFGAQVKGVETAKGLEADLNAKVEDAARKADEAK
jgi:hypothetical protein